MPNSAGIRVGLSAARPVLEFEAEIAPFGWIKAHQPAGAVAPLDIASSGNVNAPFVEHGRVQEIVPVLPLRGGFRVNVKLPEQLTGLRLERADPTVALRSDDLGDTAGINGQRTGKFSKEDVGAWRIVLPHDFTRVLVKADQGGRHGRGHRGSGPVCTVPGNHVNEIAIRGANGTEAFAAHDIHCGKNAELGRHIDAPDGFWESFPAPKRGCIQAEDFRGGADEPQAIPLHEWRTSHSEQGSPVKRSDFARAR